jgi:MFS family permease
MMADSVEHVISYWMLFQKFHSPELGGFAMLSHWLPILFLGVYSGALADRFDPRRLIQIAALIFTSVSIAWGFLFLTGRLEVWHAMLLLVAHGCASLLWAPASQVLIHDIVGSELLHSAIRLNATGRWLGMLMGPGLGAGILLALGPAWGLFVNALIYVPAILWLWKAPYGPRFRKVQIARSPFRGFGEVMQALKQVGGDRTIVSMLLLAGGASLFIGGGYHTQMPEYAHDLGHGDPGMTYSMLLGADAAGALLAGLVLESRGLMPAHPRTALTLALLWACAITGFAASSFYGLALALLFAAGFLELSFNAMAQTLVQAHAPAALRGRIVGLYTMAALGMRAFSGVTIGVVGGLIGIHWSLALSAMAVLTLTSALLAFTLKGSR